jgi:hypothetical protein
LGDNNRLHPHRRQPSSRVLEFTDPNRYQAAICASNIELFPATKGDFHAELIQIDPDRLWMQRRSETLPAISYGVVIAERAVIEFRTSADRPAFRRKVVEVPPGTIVVDDRRPTHRRCSSPHRRGSLSLPPADLAAAGRAIVGRKLTVPSVMHIVRPALALMAMRLSLHEEAGQLAKVARTFSRTRKSLGPWNRR